MSCQAYMQYTHSCDRCQDDLHSIIFDCWSNDWVNFFFLSEFQLPTLFFYYKMSSKFNTLEREKLFLNPSSNKFGYPELQKLVKPHIDSFNSLLDPPRQGLLNFAIDDIGTQEIFDKPNNSPERGNKLSSKFPFFF